MNILCLQLSKDMATIDKVYRNTSDRALVKPITEKQQYKNQEINFRDNRSSFASLQRFVNGYGIIQRTHEKEREVIYNLIYPHLWKPMFKSDMNGHIRYIEEVSECEAIIEILYEEEMFQKTIVKFVKGREVVYSIMMIHATDDYIRKEKGEYPCEQMPQNLNVVRVIFGRGNIANLKEQYNESTSHLRGRNLKFAFCEDRQFGMQLPTDINVDKEHNCQPSIEGSVDNPETYCKILSYAKKNGLTINGVDFEHIPFYFVKIKGVLDGIAVLKQSSENIGFYDTNGIIGLTGELTSDGLKLLLKQNDEGSHHHKHHHKHH